MTKTKRNQTAVIQARWSERIRVLREKREISLQDCFEAPTLRNFSIAAARKRFSNKNGEEWKKGNSFAALSGMEGGHPVSRGLLKDTPVKKQVSGKKPTGLTPKRLRFSAEEGTPRDMVGSRTHAPRPSAGITLGQVGASKLVSSAMLKNIKNALRSPVRALFDEKARRFVKFRANAIWAHQTMLVVNDEELFSFDFGKWKEGKKFMINKVFQHYEGLADTGGGEGDSPGMYVDTGLLAVSDIFTLNKIGVKTKNLLGETDAQLSSFITVSISRTVIRGMLVYHHLND